MSINGWADAVADLQDACLDQFGVPVRYLPSIEKRPGLNGVAIEISGVFDDNRQTVNLMGGGGMEAVVPRPVVEVRLVDLGIDPMEGDEVMVNEITYRILDVEMDGYGTAVLVLQRNRDPFS